LYPSVTGTPGIPFPVALSRIIPTPFIPSARVVPPMTLGFSGSGSTAVVSAGATDVVSLPLEGMTTFPFPAGSFWQAATASNSRVMKVSLVLI